MLKTHLLVSALVFLTLYLTLPTSAFAHPGNTASDGCHYCRTNCDRWGEAWDERHCHGGYSEPETPTYRIVEPIYPTATPTSRPLPTPTNTPVPTATPTLTPTPSPTATPTEEPTPTPVPEVKGTTNEVTPKPTVAVKAQTSRTDTPGEFLTLGLLLGGIYWFNKRKSGITPPTS